MDKCSLTNRSAKEIRWIQARDGGKSRFDVKRPVGVCRDGASVA